MAYPLCMAMDQDQETRETKILSKDRKNAIFALRALPLPNTLSLDRNASAYLEETKRLLTLKADENHKPSKQLLNFLESIKEDKDSTYYFLGQCYYDSYLMDFDCVFTYFLPLLEKDDIRAKTALLQILKTWPNDMVTKYYKNLNSIMFMRTDDLIINAERVEKIEAILLDALYEIEDKFHLFKYEILDYLVVRYLKHLENYRDLSGEKKYLKQAIRYSLCVVIKSSDLRIKARERLISILTTEDAYDIYNSFLIPFLEAGGKDAQDLYNEVAYALPQARNRFDNHFSNLRKKGEVTKIQDIVITRILREYPQFLRNKTGGNSLIGAFSPNSLMPLDYQPNIISTPNSFAEETSCVGIFAGLTDEEEKLSPKALYMLGMKFMNKNNPKAICALLKAAEGGNKDAIRKLRDYRKSKAYKNGETTDKTDSIEYHLYIEDKDRGNLITFEKKESKTVSHSVQTMRSSSVSSQGKQRRQKNNQKEKSEEISAAVPVLTSSKKERKLQKSEPLKSSESIINEPNVENKPTTTLHLSLSAPVLEAPQRALEILQPTIVANSSHEVQEIKEPIHNIEIKNDQLPTVPQEESGGAENVIEYSPITPERKIRKTLARRQSLIFEKTTQNEETHKPTKIQRTRSLMNLKIETQGADIIPTEKPTKKKRNEHPTKISLKRYLPTRNSEKKLERQKSKNNLLELTTENFQDNQQPDHANKSSSSFKKLTRSLSDRDLKRKSDVPLNEAVITKTLNEFKEQGIIDWTRTGNTISATKRDDPEVHLTIHAHDKSDKAWSQRPEIVSDFLEFSSECDEDLKESISQIGKRKSSKK